MLSLLFQAVAPPSPPKLPPPPPIVTAVPTPPPVFVPTTIEQIGTNDAPITLDVEVAGEGGTLWSGPLRVSRASNGSYRQERSEPPAAVCPGERYATRVRSTGLSVNLSATGYDREGGDAFNVTVRWSRVADAPCPLPAGVRTVELTQPVRLPPGGTATLRGDGGLTVRLRRAAR